MTDWHASDWLLGLALLCLTIALVCRIAILVGDFIG